MGNLLVVKKTSLFEKIKNSIKRLFRIDKTNFEEQEIKEFQKIEKNNFKEEIKFEENIEQNKLLEIQRKLEDGGLTVELAKELTKDLTSEEKMNLLQLYKTQITELDISLKKYKEKILTIRKKIIMEE